MTARILSELAVAVALAAVLSFLKIPLPHLLYGGSISLHTLPLFVVAFRHGGRRGALAGGAYGIVNFITYPVVVHPFQIALDYPLAFAGVGVAGVFARARGEPLSPLRSALGIAIGSVVRLAAHFISGWIFFAEYVPEGQPVWLYSLTYNISYIGPEMLIDILLVQLILRRI